MKDYELQPTKSVVLNISHKQCKQESNNSTFTLGPNKMTSVESVTHLGIIRTTSLKRNMTENVEENIFFFLKQGEAPIAYLWEDYMVIVVLM